MKTIEQIAADAARHVVSTGAVGAERHNTKVIYGAIRVALALDRVKAKRRRKLLKQIIP